MRDQLLGGRYRLVRQLGEGGMGQVWEAQDERLGRPVAVKLISLLAGGGSRGDEARARFLREARITARLQHPNIVTIHDLGETGTGNDRVPFLVMELVRGEGLDAKLCRGVATLPDAARWGAQISDALADAHNAGIMHRDIKPSNILITPSGVVKVLDFGVARAAAPYATADRLTQTGFIVGTPPYMAPEQARGFPEPGSDLYALGCLLFELITGQLPFLAPDTVGYLTAHLTQEPPKPSSVSAGIPPAWDNLVLTLLHKDPNQRYPNAADLSRALRQLDHAHVPTTAGPSRIPPQSEPRAALLAQLATAMRAAHDVAATRIPDTLSSTQHLLRQLDRAPEPQSPADDRTQPFTTPGTTPPTHAVSTPGASRVSPQPDTAVAAKIPRSTGASASPELHRPQSQPENRDPVTISVQKGHILTYTWFVCCAVAATGAIAAQVSGNNKLLALTAFLIWPTVMHLLSWAVLHNVEPLVFDDKGITWKVKGARHRIRWSSVKYIRLVGRGQGAKLVVWYLPGKEPEFSPWPKYREGYCILMPTEWYGTWGDSVNEQVRWGLETFAGDRYSDERVPAR
ncbi:serine/threonine-protein kinase [Streptomyces sp. LZ34]